MREMIEELLEAVASGKKTVKDAADFLLQEVGRGGRIFVIDENMRDLETELAALRYTIYPVPPGLDDDRIKKEIYGRVFVTNNGKDFVDGVNTGHYGLIWVLRHRDAKTVAKEIEAVVRQVNFDRELEQVVRI